MRRFAAYLLVFRGILRGYLGILRMLTRNPDAGQVFLDAAAEGCNIPAANQKGG